MRRASVTIPEELDRALRSYVKAQEAPPSLTAIIVAALREYLSERGYLRTEQTLRITPAKKGSGFHDISRTHDRYLSDR